jgi:alanine-synthesizing transaminase
MFSARTSWNRTENRWNVALERARSQPDPRPLCDLTESNPTRSGIYDSEPLVRLLGDPRGSRYQPLPFGHPEARSAVSQYYRRRGLPVSPDNVVLTASTSEAYGWLFTLLADRNDAVLVPRPGYPLLDWLAATQEVDLRPYPLTFGVGWRLDVPEIARRVDEHTRAIVVVHPNNPTGTFVRREEADSLVRLAADRKLALVVDEVFGDFRWDEAPPDALASFTETAGCLAFVLSGLSKVALLPQLKLGWIVVHGPTDLVREAMARLEIMADTYLSVGTPVQLALPEILARSPQVVEAARHRITSNLRVLDRLLLERGAEFGVRRLPMEGGWYAVIEVPRIHDEERWTLLLLERDRLIVHPGYFFDFDRDGVLVVSLLPSPDLFEQGVSRLVGRITAECR